MSNRRKALLVGIAASSSYAAYCTERGEGEEALGIFSCGWANEKD